MNSGAAEPGLGAASETAEEAGLHAALVAVHAAYPAASGIASFAVTILSDGTIHDVRYIGGSLGEQAGAALAAMLEGRRVRASVPQSQPIRPVVGPIDVGVPKD